MSDSQVRPVTESDSRRTPAVTGAGLALAPATGRRPRRRGAWRMRLEILLLAGPAVAVFVGFVIVPIVLAAYYGFFRWKGYGRPTDFVGLQNYAIILKDPEFHAALTHNLEILLLSLLIQGPVAIGFALLLNRRMRGASVFRVLVFVPWVVSEVIAGTGWALMLQTNGAVNDLLGKLGLQSWQHDWLSDPHIALWSLMMII